MHLPCRSAARDERARSKSFACQRLVKCSAANIRALRSARRLTTLRCSPRGLICKQRSEKNLEATHHVGDAHRFGDPHRSRRVSARRAPRLRASRPSWHYFHDSMSSISTTDAATEYRHNRPCGGGAPSCGQRRRLVSPAHLLEANPGLLYDVRGSRLSIRGHQQ